MSMTTGLPRAVGKNVVKWTPVVANLIEDDYDNFFKDYVKVAYVIEQLSHDNEEFRSFSMIYQRGIVGKCLKQIGYVKHSRTPQGYIYVHKRLKRTRR